MINKAYDSDVADLKRLRPWLGLEIPGDYLPSLELLEY